MNPFDNEIIVALHHYIRASPIFNDMMQLCSSNDFLNGGILVSLLWFFWFHPDENLTHRREQVVTVIVGTFLAITVGRILTNVIPFRMRPVLVPALVHFYPNRFAADGLRLETSMPSDHAVMFFALATGIFCISKKTGVIAFLYVSLFICFSRIYVGLHYPSDILVGAAVGIFIQLIVTIPPVNKIPQTSIFRFYAKFPGLFYLLFFWLTFQIATMFESTRELAHFFVSDILHLY